MLPVRSVKFSSKGSNSETEKGRAIFFVCEIGQFCVPRLDLIHIAIKCQDTPYGYLVVACMWKKNSSKGSNSETKKKRAIIFLRDTPF